MTHTVWHKSKAGCYTNSRLPIRKPKPAITFSFLRVFNEIKMNTIGQFSLKLLICSELL